MPRLIVNHTTMSPSDTTDISLFVSMQYAYGIYDEDPDKLINLTCQIHNLENTGQQPPAEFIGKPYYVLKNSLEQEIHLVVSRDEYY